MSGRYRDGHAWLQTFVDGYIVMLRGESVHSKEVSVRLNY